MCGSRFMSDATFIANYLGAGGAAPTQVTLPNNVNMRKFTLTHSHTSMCANPNGSGTGLATTTWYGSPCATNANLIHWEYMQTDIEGFGSHCSDNPAHRIWTRSTTDTLYYFGDCTTGAEATGIPLPTSYDFYSYTMQNHHHSGNPGVTSIWVGHVCSAQTLLQWDRLTTPAPNHPSGECNPMKHWDRSDATWGGAGDWLGIGASGNRCGYKPPYPLNNNVPIQMPARGMSLSRDRVPRAESVVITITNYNYYNPSWDGRLLFIDENDGFVASGYWWRGSGLDPLATTISSKTVPLIGVPSNINKVRVFIGKYYGNGRYSTLYNHYKTITIL